LKCTIGCSYSTASFSFDVVAPPISSGIVKPRRA
jgi:hypothetical protein